jgi:cytochrome oxidase Cu insertion factor (SCO1/SenC/PrrC family)
MRFNILINLSRFRISIISKTKAQRLLSRAVIGVLLCCALEKQASGVSIRQDSSKPAQSSNSQARHQHPSSVQPAQKQKGDLNPSIPDVEVINQDGKKIHFYSDLIKNKVVVISFIFTTCTFICPMQASNLSKLQGLLGKSLGKDVHILFVSTDPETDTPERLKTWGAQFGAKPGWSFLTGKKAEIDKVAMAFTGVEALKGEHSPVVFIGSDQKGIWIRTYSLASPEKLHGLVEDLKKGKAK